MYSAYSRIKMMNKHYNKSIGNTAYNYKYNVEYINTCNIWILDHCQFHCQFHCHLHFQFRFEYSLDFGFANNRQHVLVSWLECTDSENHITIYLLL